MVTERELTEQVKRLRDKGSRPEALARLLELLAELIARSGFRQESQRVRRVADDMALDVPDTSGMGHDDTRSMAARIVSVYDERIIR